VIRVSASERSRWVVTQPLFGEGVPVPCCVFVSRVAILRLVPHPEAPLRVVRIAIRDSALPTIIGLESAEFAPTEGGWVLHLDGKLDNHVDAKLPGPSTVHILRDHLRVEVRQSSSVVARVDALERRGVWARFLGRTEHSERYHPLGIAVWSPGCCG